MRCPKCGFISFDHLETCKKCQKYLGDIVAELNGTTYDAAPPLFLTIATAEEETVPFSSQQAGERETSSMFTDEQVFAMEGDTGDDVALDQEMPQEIERHEIEFAGFDEELEVDLGTIAEMSAQDEFTLEEELADDEAQPSLPAMDFGDLDISDLAPPPATEQPEPIRFEEPPVLSDLEPVAALSPTPPSVPPVSASRKSQGGLEDLNFNGLDLESPAKLVSGSAAGKRFLPSVKTGTALDKFDIDLGELFTDNKK